MEWHNRLSDEKQLCCRSIALVSKTNTLLLYCGYFLEITRMRSWLGDGLIDHHSPVLVSRSECLQMQEALPYLCYRSAGFRYALHIELTGPCVLHCYLPMC
jgi:hypothetical protein